MQVRGRGRSPGRAFAKVGKGDTEPAAGAAVTTEEGVLAKIGRNHIPKQQFEEGNGTAAAQEPAA